MLKYVVFWFVFRVLGRLPLPAIYFVADLTAAAGYLLASGARSNVHDNLRHVMPDASETKRTKAAKRIFRNVAYYYADLAQLPKMDVDQFLRERLVYTGIDEYIRPQLAAGRGVVMLSGHVGNAEMAGQALIPLGIPCFAVTEPVKPDRLARMLNDIRMSKGLEFMPVGVPAAKRIIRTLRGGGMVALMGDRDIHGPRMLLPFFGEETWLPTGPIEVALRTGAAIVPSFSARRGRYVIEAVSEEPIEIVRTTDFQADVRTAMLEFIRRMEARLRAEPDQWIVFERLWDADKAVGDSEKQPQTAAA